jgi:hypothetical protein
LSEAPRHLKPIASGRLDLAAGLRAILVPPLPNKALQADQLVGPPAAYLWRWLLNAGTLGGREAFRV